MRAVRRSTVFFTVLLSLAVLLAHTARATNVRHISPALPPCPLKVAAAQPNPEKKPLFAAKRIVRSRFGADGRNASGSFFFAAARAASFLSGQGSAQIATARSVACISPQHRRFSLRI